MKSSNQIRIIEFMGLPGCGKTTICESLVEIAPEIKFLLNSTDLVARGFLHRLWSFFQDCSFSYLFSLIYYIFVNNVSRKKGMLVYMVNLRMKYARFFREHNTDECILLVDQGFVQGLGSMALGRDSVSKTGLASLLKHWKVFESSMLLVDCEISAEESARRVSERNTLGGEFDRLRGDDLLNAMTSHVRRLKTVKESLYEKGFLVKRISINTSYSIENSIERILQEI